MKKTLDIKKLILLNMPYILLGLFATNFGEAWRMAQGTDASEKFLSLVAVLPGALQSFWPSLHPLDLLVGLCCGVGLSKQPGPARLGLHPSLRSKFPCVSILRASYCHAAGWAHGRVDNSSDSGQTRFSPWQPLGSAHPLRSLSPLCACLPRFLIRHPAGKPRRAAPCPP